MEISGTRFILAVYSACFDPPPVCNSVLRYDERESGVFVTYRCNSGFAFESGSFEETLECLSETKTWDRYLGDCKRNPPNNYTTAKNNFSSILRAVLPCVGAKFSTGILSARTTSSLHTRRDDVSATCQVFKRRNFALHLLRRTRELARSPSVSLLR